MNTGGQRGPDGAASACPADRRLGPAWRLRSGRQFQEAFGQSRGVAGRTMVVWTRQAEDAGGRLGVVASKRTFRRAVDRNRARRLIREAFRSRRSDLNLHCDCVIVARRRILEASRAEIEQDLVAILSRCQTGCRGEAAPGRDA